jgi:hypothetical protein
MKRHGVVVSATALVVMFGGLIPVAAQQSQPPADAQSRLERAGLIHAPLEGAAPTAASFTEPHRVTFPRYPGPESLETVVEEYCVRCHSDRRRSGNLSLASFDPTNAPASPETAERMIRKLRAGMMPPAGRDRPDDVTMEAFIVSLEEQMDAAFADDPNPGSRTFQRLNQAEYARSIYELFGLEIDPSGYLPPDTKSANFDNIADVQMLSATLMDAYLNAAGEIARLAVGDPDAAAGETAYRVPRLASQTEHVDGTPFGTRGGAAVTHIFPADGEYTFRIILHSTPTGQLFGRTRDNEQIEISVDGERVALLNIDRWMSQADPEGMNVYSDPVRITAGPHVVAAAFIPKFEGPVDEVIDPVGHSLADTQIGYSYGITTLPHLREMAILGPENVTGVSDTPSRDEIFQCRPTSPAEGEACAEDIVSRIGTRAYRRPLSDDEMVDLMGFYAESAAEDGFEIGVRTAIQAILASPHFIFRFEEVEGTGQVRRLSDLDLASRLSFFLWATPPDGELIDVAREGRLSDPATLEAQVRRMLADPRSEALGTRFAAQWLRLQDLEKVHPDALQFPYFDQNLAEDMTRETVLFFHNLVEEDRSALELLTADYTFANEALARHYDIEGVAGTHFRRVDYPDDARNGVLGHGSVLTLTSHANRTSPVLRGKWVMEVLLGTPPPPPPPDVPDLDAEGEVADGRFLTVREMLERHRADPSCNSCHRVIDPIGLALENFDVTGRWRTRDAMMPVDVMGELYDGTSLQSPQDLRDALLTRPEPLLRTFTENLMAYAVGRRVEYYDQPTIRAITRDAAENDYRMSSFIMGVVNSPAFQMKAVETLAEEIEMSAAPSPRN